MNTPICYALKVYKYDHYEWEETVAVSFDADLLREHYKTVDHLYKKSPLVELSDREFLYKKDEPHWTIEPITFLPTTTP